jgi:hypothetical protein
MLKIAVQPTPAAMAWWVLNGAYNAVPTAVPIREVMRKSIL